jgi:hypothetical protein
VAEHERGSRVRDLVHVDAGRAVRSLDRSHDSIMPW